MTAVAIAPQDPSPLKYVPALLLIASLVVAIAALLDMSPLTILPSTILAEVTVLSLGVPILTDDPWVIIKKSLPEAGAAEKMISLPEIANPSEGCPVPALGF